MAVDSPPRAGTGKVPPAGGPAAAGRGRANFFTRKLGPLPVWAWGAIGVGGIGVLYYLHKKGSSSSSSAAMPATAAQPATGTLGGFDTGGGGATGGGSGGGGLGTFLAGQSAGSGQDARIANSRRIRARATPVAAPIPSVQAPAIAPADPVPAPVVPPPSAPTPYQVSQIAAQAGGAQNLSPAQLNAISVLEQPQNQPGVNPNVNAAPVTAPSSLGPATGVGQRYVTPEGYAFTYG